VRQLGATGQKQAPDPFRATPTRPAIHCRPILDEHDGPMLRHGLQGLHNTLIHTPRSPRHRPDPDLLARRSERFRKAGRMRQHESADDARAEGRMVKW